MILLDNIIYSLQENGGVTRVWDSIIESSLKENKIEFEYLHQGKISLSRDYFNKLVPLIIRRYLNVNVQNVELFHSSYFRVHSSKNVINVVTVHDFVYEKFDKGISRLIHLTQKKHSLKKADAIICVSKNTMSDLLKYHPWIDPKIVTVIYNGVGNDFFPLHGEELISHTLSKYLLFIGGRNVHKNFIYVLELLSKDYCRDNNFQLIVVGGGELNHAENNLINKKGLKKVIHLPNVDNNKLNKLYNGAFALIYPSYYEGFGIPPLEAMKAGCPVICSNRSSLPEVVGNAGLMVEPDNVEMGLNHIRNLSNQSFRKEIIINGFKQAEKFPWEKTGEQTINLYKQLLGVK